MNWKYQDKDKTAVCIVEDNAHRSCLVIADEIQTYLANGGVIDPYEAPSVDPRAEALGNLMSTDKDMARVVEDLFTALVKTGVLKESDLPAASVAKIKERLTWHSTMKTK